MDETRLVDIGPEAFTDGDEEVISYKGENYYKSCPERVTGEDDGAGSFCVKRVNHPGDVHEDFHGRIKVKKLET